MWYSDLQQKAPARKGLYLMAESAVSEKLRLVSVPIDQLKPAPENDLFYHPVKADSEDIEKLALSIAALGILDPLTVTSDLFIVSGHRRYAAARLAGVESLPCKVLDWAKDERHGSFMILLLESNRQRVKTNAELMKEELAGVDPDSAYRELVQYREDQVKPRMPTRPKCNRKQRHPISSGLMPFLNAAISAINDLQDFWPLSDRQIHYALLNDPPLKHASKPDSVYQNDSKSYQALTRLLTSARIQGHIPMEVIEDTTRPIVAGGVHDTVGGFVAEELDIFLRGYRRNLQQGQPVHIEVFGEKNTMLSILRPIACKYCVPLTIGRGQCSLPPRAKMAERFAESGKDKLILLTLTDFDPDGEQIAESLAVSLRDDFGIDDRAIDHVKVALTYEQAQRMGLHSGMDAKKTSNNYRKFYREYGGKTFELEAMPPAIIQGELEGAILAHMDKGLLNLELRAEHKDAHFIAGARRRVIDALRGCDGFSI